MVKLLTLLTGCLLATSGLAAICNSDGSASSIQACHDSINPGDKITMPIGTFTWNTSPTFNKSIKLQGKGSGQILGTTKTSNTISGGTKTFDTDGVLPGIVAGTKLRIAKQPNLTTGKGRENYLDATVVSYSGTTLTVNVTNGGGSGTYEFWYIATKPKTTVINNASLNLAQQAGRAGNQDISGIQFIAANADSIHAYTDAYMTKKAIVHDCWFQTGAGNVTSGILAQTNQMLIYNCSFDDTFSQQAVGIQFKWEDPTGLSSWRTNSSWGATDTNGATNFYVEDNVFYGYLNAADWDSNGRIVFRHNVLNNSGMTSHGADTGGPWGSRHVELYENELIFDDFGDNDGTITAALTWFYWHRGGSAVITDNVLPRITSGYWGLKSNISFSVLPIDRNAGCYACWNNGYPVPHQVGQGSFTGITLLPWSCSTYTDDARYGLFLEPVYIWNNSGTGGDIVSLNEESDECSGNGNQMLTTYLQAGRDYYNDGTPKPGYTKGTYPHQLRP